MSLYSDPKLTFGRDKIYTYEPITPTSVIRIVKAAMEWHKKNVEDIDWNFKLYRGNDSRILDEKEQLSEINHKVVVSQEAAIVDVKAGLLTQNPVTLLNTGDTSKSEDILTLSTMYKVMNKHRIDKECAGQAGICGTSYVFIEKNTQYKKDARNGQVPFKKSILNPGNVFPLWEDSSDNDPIAMVYITNEVKEESFSKVTTNESGYSYNTQKRYTIYTNTFTYTFREKDETPEITEAMPWGIPIVEKYCNPYRIGFFERVESLIYARSILRSDEMTNISSFVNAIWYIWGIAIPEIDAEATEEVKEAQKNAQDDFLMNLKQKRMLWNPDAKTKDESGMLLVGAQLDNEGTKILDETLKNDIIALAKIPDYVAGIGGSGNGIAAQTASGWMATLLDAIDQEPYWYEGLRKELLIDIAICQEQGLLEGLSVEDIDFNIQRKTFDDKQSAAQTFTTLINAGIPWEDALDIANITPDAHNLADKMEKWGKTTPPSEDNPKEDENIVVDEYIGENEEEKIGTGIE